MKKSKYRDIFEANSDVLCPMDCHNPGVNPFLKWPGGKRWLAKDLAYFIKLRLTRNYYEPFLGGGAVFFALRPDKAILSDINEDLINVYCQVRNNPEEIIGLLKSINVSKRDYYRIRDETPKSLIMRAVRFLYLNRTAFGGVYRLNGNGKFNVPYGGGKRTPDILWRNNLIKSASECLQNIELIASDFERVIDRAMDGDVVYCDPTYTVAHDNNGFVRYNERNFSWADQERLSRAALKACERGSLVLVSNASYPSLNKLYSPFKPLSISRMSLLCPKIEARREIKEYLFILDPKAI